MSQFSWRLSKDFPYPIEYDLTGTVELPYYETHLFFFVLGKPSRIDKISLVIFHTKYDLNGKLAFPYKKQICLFLCWGSFSDRDNIFLCYFFIFKIPALLLCGLSLSTFEYRASLLIILLESFMFKSSFVKLWNWLGFLYCSGHLLNKASILEHIN